ncbi:unnamed protein product [Prorocentrum cordatum]|uniref:Uncharacterized protein n=1 Tax=Prorocentrum cordatum TaxID=2364126 RepID=A0ABN9UAT9_9DINO|nr:unnamed protein product [Polarella glacialis]
MAEDSDEEPPPRPQMFPGSSPRMLSCSSDRTLRLFDMKTGVLKRSLAGHKREVLCLAVDWKDHRALSGSADHTVASTRPQTFVAAVVKG